MKHIKVILAVVLFTGLIACNQEDPPIPELNVTPKTQQLVDADNSFGLSLFKNLYETYGEDDNVFISPTSVGLALAMTYNGANGTTKEAFEECLQLQGLTVEQINVSYKSLMDGLISLDPDVIMQIANSIWYKQGFSVLQDFIDVNIEYYNAQVNSLDFNNPVSVDIINNWVADNTNNKISTIISSIEPDIVMYLINAIYFKGIWKYTFDIENTIDLPFYKEDGTVTDVPTMSLKADLATCSNNLFHAVELPYGNGNFSMVLMLPNIDVSMDEMISSLNSENWNNWMESFETTPELSVQLPRFKFEYEKKLNDVLIDMGLGIAFSPLADLTGINPNGGLFISYVKHKTFVEVNEEGTEAAAVTVVGIGYTSAGESISFNKPFLFAIKEKTTNAIVFIGKIGVPEE